MRRLTLTVFAVALTGCATPPEFESITSRRANVEWRLGDAVGELTVDFATSPGATVRLVARADGASLDLTQFADAWTATGSLARGSWRGVPDTAPVHLAGWIALALAYGESRAVSEGLTEYRTARYSVRYAKSAGTLRRFELVAADSGDRFRVVFEGD